MVLYVAPHNGDKQAESIRTSLGHRGAELPAQPTRKPYAWRMIRWRAAAVGNFSPICNHSLGETGITTYLADGGRWKTLRRWRLMRFNARRSSMIG